MVVMETIGLIGGMSWHSTVEYYRIINELVAERRGGHELVEEPVALVVAADHPAARRRPAAAGHTRPSAPGRAGAGSPPAGSSPARGPRR